MAGTSFQKPGADPLGSLSNCLVIWLVGIRRRVLVSIGSWVNKFTNRGWKWMEVCWRTTLTGVYLTCCKPDKYMFYSQIDLIKSLNYHLV